METYFASIDFGRTAWRLVLLASCLCLTSSTAFGQGGFKPDPALRDIKHIVVIYQENWSFDSLYGLFPGANGLAQASPKSLNQTDRFDQPLSAQIGQPFSLVSGSLSLTTPPPPINNGHIDLRFTPGLNTLLPYDVMTNSTLMPNDTTGDLVHRFWHEQSQIDQGAMDWFVTWSDNPGLTMSYFDATNLPEGLLAQNYTLADNFFHAAFGGSFLNHQFLISAAAPVYPNALAGMQAVLDTDGQLLVNPATGKIVHDGNITPIGGVSFTAPAMTFDKNYAVNTIFSANLVPTFSQAGTPALLPSLNDSDPSDATRPFIPTIGDRLSAKGIGWKWYSGGWDNALASTVSNPGNNGVVPPNAPVDPLFQWHHQPFAYYDNYAPFKNGARNPVSAAHLQDENDFFLDLKTARLPAVVFIKALGPDNEHPGYAGLLQGQQHVADLVSAVKASDYWDNTLIIVTYDEHGGRWDHVTPPVTGIWGDGSRVPAIIIGPLAKRHFVDHTQYDTLSILKTIEDRFGLEPLSALDAQATSLKNSLQPQQ
ncbi:MAG TPA: acid phosphatase [Candidatus Acidoferrum sp.]|nr:acid phosphatase [Candidatus Acidoferrum sp.]